MPQISLTDFVDIVSSSGTPKATKVRQVKRRPPYDPASDFYRRIREAIIQVHQDDQPKEAIDRLLTTLNDPKKMRTYPTVASGYKKWWGRKSLIWFEPPSKQYSAFDVDVSVNPELGLDVEGKPHLIKLYFKNNPLDKNKVDIITHLMSVALSPLCTSPTTMSVLDVRKAKLISPTVPIPTLNGMLQAELAYISALWPSV